MYNSFFLGVCMCACACACVCVSLFLSLFLCLFLFACALMNIAFAGAIFNARGLVGAVI